MATVIEVMAKLTGNASGMVKSFMEARRAAQETADQTKVSAGQAKEAMQGLALPAGIVAGGAAIIGVSLAKMASEAEQNVGAVESVFKQYGDVVKKTSANAANDVGISTSQYQQFASIVGSQLKNMGVPLDAVAGGTDNLIKKGADLASMYGGTTADAIQAISAMLRGETDPIERYGVSINEAAVEAKMLEMGLGGLTGEAEKNAKLQAKLAILNKQTADATGNFGREADTAAGAMQRANAKWQDAQTQLGTHLLPIMTEVAGALSGVSKFASENSGVVIGLGAAFAGIVATILLVNGAMAAYTVATQLATAATWLFQRASKAIGIGLLIAAVVGIVTYIQHLWDTSAEFRDFWKGVWDSIVSVVEAVEQAISGFIGDVIREAQNLWNILSKGDFTGLFGLQEDHALVGFLFDLRDGAQSLWNMLTKGDFDGKFFGLEEDNGLVQFILGLRTAGEDLYNLLFRGDFTGLFGLEEDSPIVTFLLGVHKTAKEITDILFHGQFNGLFGLEEDSPVVNLLFTIREAAMGVGQWMADAGKAISDFFAGAGQAAGGLDIFGFLKDTGVIAFFEDMGRKVGPAIEQISKAWEKVWEFISNFVTTVGPPFIATVLAIWKTVWDAVVAVWNAVGQPLMNIIVAAWDILVAGLKAVWDIIVAVVKGAMEVVFGIIKVVTGLITGNWGQVWDGIVQIFGGIWDTIMSVLGSAFGFIGQVFKSGLDIISNIWNAVWGAIGGVLGAVWNNIGSIIGSALGLVGGIISGFLGGIWDNITGAWNGLMGWIGDLWGGFAGMMTDWWSSITGAASKGVEDTTRPIFDVFGAIGGFIGGIFTGIANTVSAAWTWVTDLLKAIFAAFMEEHGAQLAALWATISGIFTAIGNFIAGIWNGIVSVVTGAVTWYVNAVMTAFTAVWGFISGILNTVFGFVAGIWNAIVGAVQAAAKTYWDIVTTIFSAVWGFLSGLFNTIAGFIGGVWNGIVDTIRGAVSFVWNAISTGFNNARNTVVTVFTNVVGFLGNIWGNIVNGVSSMIGQVTGFFSGIWSTITGAFSGAATWLWNAGKNIVEGLINGVKSLAGTIGNAFLSMIPGWIVEPFKAALGIHSPSRLFKSFGRFIIQGLGIGVKDEQKTAVRAMDAAAAAVTAAGQGMEVAAPKIMVPEVPNIAAQLALPPLTQDILLNFVGPKSPVDAIKSFAATLQGGETTATGGYSVEALQAPQNGTQVQPEVHVNLTAKIVNPWTGEEVEVKVREVATEVVADGLAGTARATRNSRNTGMGGF